MYENFFGFNIQFGFHQLVNIKSADVIGTIAGIRMDSESQELEYLVSFPYGSVWIGDAGELGEPHPTTGGYNCDEGWFTANELEHLPTP